LGGVEVGQLVDLAIITHGSAKEVAEDLELDVIGPADLSAGATFVIRFTGGPARSGRVISIEDSGAHSVIEVEGTRWRLGRRSTVQAGGPGSTSFYPWVVGTKA
jgi:hypothetical protein